MDEHSALEDLSVLAATGQAAELSRKWLTFFGADSMRDLDIGMLEAIADYVRRGATPPS
ncbi:hypothetical protein [Burkholderia sp. Ac-20345]|uniref:hypothetical protein n=1 Tax=Burkholderia sp. Ac-20345 TaxID=2703891 RepID=UPI00197BB824|nr:hypothetical protein [Burkholderia sp. Ac-20345]